MKQFLKTLLLSLLVLSTIAEARLAPIKPGVPGRKRGDIIAPMLDEQVAAWCDFSKQIVVTRSNILCAYVGEKTFETGLVPAARPNHKVASRSHMTKSRPGPKDLTNLYEMTEYGGA